MVVFSIPTSSTQTWYSQSIVLSGVTYVLEFRYNSRMQRWIMSILDSGEQPIIMGIPLLIQRNLTSQYTQLAIPAGALYCTDDTGNALQPSLSSFLVDHTVIYLDPAQS
jgi:hypothetical protein